jgi:hypothetical protein
MEKDLRQLIAEMDAIEQDNDDILHPTHGIENPKEAAPDPALAELNAKVDTILDKVQAIFDHVIPATKSSRG